MLKQILRACWKISDVLPYSIRMPDPSIKLKLSQMAEFCGFAFFKVLKIARSRQVVLTWESCLAWCLCGWSFWSGCTRSVRWAGLPAAGPSWGWTAWSKSWRGPRGLAPAAPSPWRWSPLRTRTTWWWGSPHRPAWSGRTWTRCAAAGVSSWCIPTWWRLQSENPERSSVT